MKKLLSYR